MADYVSRGSKPRLNERCGSGSKKLSPRYGGHSREKSRDENYGRGVHGPSSHTVADDCSAEIAGIILISLRPFIAEDFPRLP